MMKQTLVGTWKRKSTVAGVLLLIVSSWYSRMSKLYVECQLTFIIHHEKVDAPEGFMLDAAQGPIG